jgi:spermidine synthase
VPIAGGSAELVPDEHGGVTLLVDGAPSSHLDLADPRHLEFEYMAQMAAVVEAWGDPGAPAAPLRALHLGAAGCSLARAFEAARPGSRQLAVELDAELAALVRTWFDLPRSPALRLRVGEARAELGRVAPASFDVVVRDAFASGAVPAHLTTREFTEQVAATLRPGGVYLANCADRPPLTLARSEAATVAEVFTHTGVVAEAGVLRGRRYGNVVLVGTHDETLLASPDLARALRSLPVPARLLVDDTAFRRGAPVRRDPPAASSPG